MLQHTVILGAGLTGLACAHELGKACTVFEADDTVGGAARTTVRNGFSFDCTGHWLHLKSPQIRQWVEALMPDTLVQIARRAAVFSHNVTTPYPFQAHTHGLPVHVVAECILGFFKARATPAPPAKTFEDYILQCMGEGIAKHFMIPYNTKLWTIHPADMAHAWCDRFVPMPTAEEVVYGALQIQGAGRALGYNTHFLYPRRGGIGALAQALNKAVEAPIHVRTKVAQVDWQSRRVVLPDGRVQPYRVLVSTVPLTDLVLQILQGPPQPVVEAARRLRATSITYWNIGVRRQNGPHDHHWTYYPEPDIPFYRAGSPSAVLADMAPPGHASYYVETAHPRGTRCQVTDQAVLAGLRRVGTLGGREEPVLWERHTIDCGYTIMDHAYGTARQTVLDWLQSVGIVAAGRYGAWMYDSMEGSLQQGKAAATKARQLLKLL